MQSTNLKKAVENYMLVCLITISLMVGIGSKIFKLLARKIIIFTRLHIYTLYKPLARKYDLRPNYQFVEW